VVVAAVTAVVVVLVVVSLCFSLRMLPSALQIIDVLRSGAVSQSDYYISGTMPDVEGRLLLVLSREDTDAGSSIEDVGS
jgi:hypothetical protein